MELFFQIALLAVGLFLLWKTGGLCVKYAVGFSTIYGFNRYSVGFLLFAISTGLPEISSAVISSLKKVPELSVGDLIGSSLVNLTLVLGIIILVAKNMLVDSRLKKKLIKASIAIFAVLIALSFFPFRGWIFGAILIAVYFGANYWSKEKGTQEKKESSYTNAKNGLLSTKLEITLKLFGSLGLLLLSSWLTVDAAVKVATLLGINLTLLGRTILAIGTSFPELVLDLQAVRRKEYALALGDLFGSSLLNITFILGILMMMNHSLELSFALKLLPYFAVVLIWSVQALIRKSAFTVKDGCVFLLIFLSYIGLSIFGHFAVAKGF